MGDPLQKILEKSLHQFANHRQYEDYALEINPLTSGGANFTSKLYNGKISAPNQKAIRFFGKVASLQEDFRSQMPTFIYSVEQLVYNKLSKIIERLEDRHNVPIENRLRMPELYWYSDKNLEEVLLIEDLGYQGFETYNRIKPITWDYASKAIEEIAKFHALGFAVETYFPEDYKEFKKGFELAEVTDTQKSFGEQMTKRGLELVRDGNRQIVEDYLEKNSAKIEAVNYQTLRRPTLVHGDFRVSNMMHKVHKNGNYEMVLIDYQTIHIGSVPKDLVYFIFTGSNAEFREKYYDKLLYHYYDQLTLTLSRLDLDINKVYPKEDFDFEMKECLVLGLVYSLIALPITTVDEENAPTLTGDLDAFANLTPSDVASVRLNEIVDDFIKWGIFKD